MKHYLGNQKFYVINEYEKLVYKVGEFEAFSNVDYIRLELELVAGWDYINPDENDIQGWCPSNRFTEDVQYEYVNQYFFTEGMQECLDWNGYTILEKIDFDLKKIIDEHNKA